MWVLGDGGAQRRRQNEESAVAAYEFGCRGHITVWVYVSQMPSSSSGFFAVATRVGTSATCLCSDTIQELTGATRPSGRRLITAARTITAAARAIARQRWL